MPPPPAPAPAAPPPFSPYDAAGDAVLDDEDEFAEHREAFGYPEEVVDLALSSRDVVLDALRRRLPPFDGSAAPWFDRLHQLIDLSEPS